MSGLLGSLRWLLIALAALGLGFLVYWGAGQYAAARDQALPPREETFPLVEVVRARPVDTLTVVETGFLRPRAQINVVPEIAGKVVEVAPQLEPGGRFAKGELLFRIDPRTFEADLARARADLAAAQAEVNRAASDAARQERLADIGAAAQSRRQQAAAALASARASLGQAQAGLTLAEKRLEDTEIRAPFDAAVMTENVALGDFVQPGTNAATIFDTGTAQIVVGLVPEDAAAVRRAAITAGGALEVQIVPSRASAGAASLTGFVKRFGEAVDQQSRTVPLVIDVPGAFSEARRGSVFANDYVRVEIPAASEEQLYAAALGTVRSERFVWTLDQESRLFAVEVTPLKRTDREVVFRTAADLQGRDIVLTALTEEAQGIKVDVLTGGGQRAEATP